jgi:hypothetical protein
MKKKPIYMSDLHYEHKLWKRQIDFQIDELEIFKHRLEEVVTRWTDTEILAQVEHFQNTFIRYKEVLDTQLHDINLHHEELVKFVHDHPVASDHVHFQDHAKLRDSVETQLEMFYSTKKEFMRFLTEAM